MVASCGVMPVRWSVPYPVPLDFCKMSRLWYQSDLRRCCGLFQESLSVLKVLFRCSPADIKGIVRRIKARSVGKRHRRRFLPVPQGAAVGTFRRLCLCHGCRMGNFMDSGLDILRFVHALVDENTLSSSTASFLYCRLVLPNPT